MGFWSTLESPTALVQIPTVWRDLLGSDFEAGWPFFAPTDQVASAYPCPSPGGEGCPRRIVEHDDALEAVCNDPDMGCETVPLTIEEIVVHALDLRRLAETLARAFGVDPAFEAVGHRRAWLGSLAMAPGHHIAVHLALPRSEAMLTEVVAELCLRRDPSVLLVPTRRRMTQQSTERLERADGHVLDLESVVALKNGGILHTSFELRTLFEPSSAATPPDNVFRQEGDFWTVCFAGETVRLKPSKGLSYLAALLREPGRELDAFQLREAAGEGVARSHRHLPGEENLEPIGDLGELIDPRAREEIQQELGVIEAELAEAEANHDLGRQEALRDRKRALADYLGEALGLGGRTRRGGSPMKRAIDQVSQAVRRSRKQIAEHHPRLHKHLEASLQLSRTFAYRPEVSISWLT